MATSTTTRDYLLRSVDMRIWKRAQRRARQNGITMRDVLLQFLEQYGQPTEDAVARERAAAVVGEALKTLGLTGAAK